MGTADMTAGDEPVELTSTAPFAAFYRTIA
jgi:hypothetical protein